MTPGPVRRTPWGFGQLDVVLGLGLGLGVWMMALHAWGIQRQWLSDRDNHQELLDRTPALERLLSRLSAQAGSRPLSWNGHQWQLDPAYPGLPAGSAPTWVHARGIHDQPASYPNCQNTRPWAKDAAHAPAWIRDQFDLIDAQLKCKDTAQASARWQGWADQVRSWSVSLAWQTGLGTSATWRWRPVADAPASGQVIGIRVCMVLDSVQSVLVRPAPGLDCLDRAMTDSSREERVWTRVWSLRAGTP